MEKKSSLGLDKTILEVKECQNEKNISCCLKCSEVLKCKLRDRYVDSVYKSMNPNSENAGFEF